MKLEGAACGIIRCLPGAMADGCPSADAFPRSSGHWRSCFQSLSLSGSQLQHSRGRQGGERGRRLPSSESPRRGQSLLPSFITSPVPIARVSGHIPGESHALGTLQAEKPALGGSLWCAQRNDGLGRTQGMALTPVWGRGGQQVVADTRQG